MFKHLAFFVNIVWRLVKFALIYPPVDLFKHNLIYLQFCRFELKIYASALKETQIQMFCFDCGYNP